MFVGVDRRDPDVMAPDAPSYVQLAERIAAGDSYELDRVGPLAGEPPGSRYPPGFPLVLALFALVTDPATGAAVLAGVFVGVVWAFARRLGGDVAATVTAVMLLASPSLRTAGGDVMADLTASTVTMLAVWAAANKRRRLAGVLAAIAVWVRVAQVVALVGIRRASVAPAVGLLSVLAASALLLRWGYQDGQTEWSLRHLWSTDGVRTLAEHEPTLPNAVAVPAMLLGLTGGLLPPGAIVVAGVALWHRPERRLVLAVVLGGVAIYLPYFYQYPRFLFPAASLVIVYAAAWVSGVSGVGVPPRDRAATGTGVGRVRERVRPSGEFEQGDL